MYAFSAAHKSLPLPSFARVTNLDNGRSVVVRVNDRGPFHEGRVIDLSYAAAVKLDIVARGTGRVEVRALTPGDADAGPVLAASPAAGRTPASKAAVAPSRTAVVTAPATLATGLDQLVQALPAGPPPAIAAAPVTATAVASPRSAHPHRRPGPVPCCRSPASPASTTPAAHWTGCSPPGSPARA